MIRVFHYSEAGGHPHNEDAFTIRHFPSDEQCFFCAVADGQGGRAGGAEAARVACETCAEAAAGLPLETLPRPETWVTNLRRADEAVASHPEAGFTTLVTFRLTNTVICGASCGDSAAVLIGPGGPNVLTDRQHKDPPVGSGAAAGVPFAANLTPPWTVLAMTDGVWKYAGWDNVFRAAAEHQGEDIIRVLLEQARLKRSKELQDDFSLVVFEGIDTGRL